MIRKHSKETRKKMSLNHADVKGKKNPMHGRTHTSETKEKISNYRKNKVWMYDPYVNIQKCIDKDSVAKYLELGWKKGRLKYQKGPSYLLGF